MEKDHINISIVLPEYLRQRGRKRLSTEAKTAEIAEWARWHLTARLARKIGVEVTRHDETVVDLSIAAHHDELERAMGAFRELSCPSVLDADATIDMDRQGNPLHPESDIDEDLLA